MSHRRTSLLPLALLLMLACAAALVPPHFPRRFSASLEVTTKHLNKSNVYPPAWRTIDVDYDFIAKRARAYVQTSYEKRQKTNGTTTLRRYDLVRPPPPRRPPPTAPPTAPLHLTTPPRARTRAHTLPALGPQPRHPTPPHPSSGPRARSSWPTRL